MKFSLAKVDTCWSTLCRQDCQHLRKTFKLEEVHKCVNLVDLEHCCKISSCIFVFTSKIGFSTAENEPSKIEEACGPCTPAGGAKRRDPLSAQSAARDAPRVKSSLHARASTAMTWTGYSPDRQNRSKSLDSWKVIWPLPCHLPSKFENPRSPFLLVISWHKIVNISQ